MWTDYTDFSNDCNTDTVLKSRNISDRRKCLVVGRRVAWSRWVVETSLSPRWLLSATWWMTFVLPVPTGWCPSRFQRSKSESKIVSCVYNNWNKCRFACAGETDNQYNCCMRLLGVCAWYALLLSPSAATSLAFLAFFTAATKGAAANDRNDQHSNTYSQNGEQHPPIQSTHAKGF